MIVKGLKYVGYTTGTYSNGKYPGLTLHFSSEAGDYYAIFNVLLQYQRSTGNHAVGDALPKKEFRVKANCAFVKFWKRTGLKPPRRISEYHKVMSKLKSLTYTAQLRDARKGKLDNSSIMGKMRESPTVDLEPTSLVAGCGQLCGNIETTMGQAGDTSNGQGLWTRNWDNESALTLQESSCPTNSSACNLECGLVSVRDQNTTNKVIRTKFKGSKGVDGHEKSSQESNDLSEFQRLQMQSVEEWLEDYNNGASI
jgi:hypothetical protein